MLHKMVEYSQKVLGKYSMLLHTKSDNQLFYFSSYVPIWFPIVYHCLCQIHVELIYVSWT